MESTAHLLPTEEHDGNERSFHEEGQNTFDGQGGAEDITYKPGVVAPVGAELKLQNQSSGHAYGKVDAEEFHPVLSGAFPFLISRAVVEGLHQAHDNCQPQGEGNEDPVVDGGEGKLCSRPVNQRSVNVCQHTRNYF